MTSKGWPYNQDPELNPFFMRRDEITLQSGCLMWGIRVIIPPKLRPEVLKELHQGHMGVVKMKAITRSYIWWPGIGKEIELAAKSCPGCQLTQREPSKYQSTHGNGLNCPGNEFILILQNRSLTACS